MKRNMVPLLGIAFVVAIISTGVFYGLFAGKLRSSAGGLGQTVVVAARNLDRGTVLTAGDLRVSEVKGALKGAFSKPEEAVGVTLLEALQENEPLLQARVASLDARFGKSGGGVPAGMRAVSIRVSESTGVVSLLRTGNKVDVQAVSERNGSVELRTILQNVEVLSVSPQPEGAGNRAVPVVTVLTRAQDTDIIALADSGARVRLALRNPLDDGTIPRHPLVLASVFQSRDAYVVPETPHAAKAAPAAPPAAQDFGAPLDHPVQLRVRVLGVSAAALGELNSQLADQHSNDSVQVAAFRADTDADDLVKKLAARQELEVVSSSRMTAGVRRPASLRAGASSCQLRVQFAPGTDASGNANLHVKPEISVPRGQGVETRKFEADLPNGRSFLVKGLLRDQDRKLLERLYPGHAWGGRELVIFVTSQGGKPLHTAALVKSSRGQ